MSDDDLFSSDSEYDEIEEPETPLWEGFDISNYNLNFDLQKSAFLIDFLKDLYKFELENDQIIIYEKKNNGIEEIIEKDKLIYFLHIDLAKIFKEELTKNIRKYGASNISVFSLYNTYFNEVKTIHEVIDNMKIYLKYHKEESEEEESEEEENKKPLMKEVKTSKYKNDNLNMLKPTIL